LLRAKLGPAKQKGRGLATSARSFFSRWFYGFLAAGFAPAGSPAGTAFISFGVAAAGDAAATGDDFITGVPP